MITFNTSVPKFPFWFLSYTLIEKFLFFNKYLIDIAITKLVY